MQSIRIGASDFYDALFEPFAKFLLGSADTGEVFFAKLLFLLILTIFINYALAQIPNIAPKSKLFAFIISLLAVRFITPAWITTTILPYSALGIALTAFFPFVIYFFFVEKGFVGSPTMRKLAWIFAAVVFGGLFLYRDIEPIDISGGQFKPGYIYLITASLSLVMLFLDKTIQRAFKKAEADNMREIHNIQLLGVLRHEYNETINKFNTSALNKADANTIIDSIKSRARANGIVDTFRKLT